MKIDTALYNNEKRHQLEGYFFVDTILGLSYPRTLVVSYLPASTVHTRGKSLVSTLVLTCRNRRLPSPPQINWSVCLYVCPYMPAD